VAGGALMVREAGGVVTDFHGKHWQLNKHAALLATNKFLTKSFLKLIRDA